MAPHSSTLAWTLPWAEKPGGLQAMGLLGVRPTERLRFHVSLSCIGEGNGNPLQCSCLENPMDRGSWWAIIHGFARIGHDLETKQPQIHTHTHTHTHTRVTEPLCGIPEINTIL